MSRYVYHKVPGYPNLEVTHECNMRYNGKYVDYDYRFDSKMGQRVPIVKIGDISIDVGRAMAMTFYGVLPYPVRTKVHGDWYNIKNLYYDIETHGGISIDGSNKDALVNFTTVPYIDRYAITKNGVILDKSTWRIIIHSISHSGVHFAQIIADGRRFTEQIAVTMYRTFIGQLAETECVMYKDGDRDNLNLSNLIAMTQYEARCKVGHHPDASLTTNRTFYGRSLGLMCADLMRTGYSFHEISGIVRVYGENFRAYLKRIRSNKVTYIPELAEYDFSNYIGIMGTDWSIAAFNAITEMHDSGKNAAEIADYFGTDITEKEVHVISNIVHNGLLNAVDCTGLEPYGHREIPIAVRDRACALIAGGLATPCIVNLIKTDVPKKTLAIYINVVRGGHTDNDRFARIAEALGA